jgi:hypothetical protein
MTIRTETKRYLTSLGYKVTSCPTDTLCFNGIYMRFDEVWKRVIFYTPGVTSIIFHFDFPKLKSYRKKISGSFLIFYD